MTRPELQVVVTLAAVVVIFVIRVRTGHAPRWMEVRHSVSVKVARQKLVGGVLILAVLPCPVYLIVRPHVGSTAVALAIASGIPAAWVLVRSAIRRRLDSVGLVVLAAYGVAVVVSFLFGGAATALKLRDVAALGAVGLACIISALIRRPLLVVAIRWLGRRDAAASSRLREHLQDRRFVRDLRVATGLAGAVFLLAAATEGVLIVAVSTAAFLAISGPLGGLTPIATVGLVIVYLRRAAHHQVSSPV
jgi:hypothetical protein